MGMGQRSWQPQAGQDRVGTAGSMAQDQGGAGKTPLRWGSSSRPRSSSMQAGSHRGRQGRQGSTGCYGAQVQAAAILGRGTGRQWDAGKVQGSRQGVGRVLPAPAGCGQPRHSQGAGRVPGAPGRVQGPGKGCRQGTALPLKRGAMFQAAMPPCFMNCPRATSKKKMGMPPTKTMSR